MGCLGNVFVVVFGGAVSGLSWCLAGLSLVYLPLWGFRWGCSVLNCGA